MFVATGGGGQTPVLRPVTHNLARVCPPLEGLHVSSAANHETHVRRAQRQSLLSCYSAAWKALLVLFECLASQKTLSVRPCTVAKKKKKKGCVSFASVLPLLHCTTLLSPIPSSFPCLPHSPFRPPLNPSASCRSVRLPVSVPIRFHLIHVTSINTQSSPDKSRPLSPPLCLSCVALHHSVFLNKLSSTQ